MKLEDMLERYGIKSIKKVYKTYFGEQKPFYEITFNNDKVRYKEVKEK